MKDNIYFQYINSIDLDQLLPLSPRPNTRFVPWMNCFRVTSASQFNYLDFEDYMYKQGIQVRPFFSNLAYQNAFAQTSLHADLLITDNIAGSGFYLPSGITLSNNDIRIISDHVNAYFR